MIIFGEIKSISGYIAEVEVVEQETTYKCLMLQPASGKIKIDIPYSVGDQVACIIQSGRNLIIGEIYNEKDFRDSEAEFEKVLIKSKKLRQKIQDEIEQSANTIKTNSNNILFNGGLNDGMVKIIPLIARLNALEAEINALKTVFTSWTPVPSDGGAALKTVVSAWSGSQMTVTQKSQLENSKVKH